MGRLDLVRSGSSGTIFEAVFPFTSVHQPPDTVGSTVLFQAVEGELMKKRTRLILLLSAMLIGGGAASMWLADTLDAQGRRAAPIPATCRNASTVEVKDAAGTVF